MDHAEWTCYMFWNLNFCLWEQPQSHSIEAWLCQAQWERLPKVRSTSPRSERATSVCNFCAMASGVRKNTRKWWSLSLQNAQWECYYNSAVGESKMTILSKMRPIGQHRTFCLTPRTFGLQRFSKCEAGWWTKKKEVNIFEEMFCTNDHEKQFDLTTFDSSSCEESSQLYLKSDELRQLWQRTPPIFAWHQLIL